MAGFRVLIASILLTLLVLHQVQSFQVNQPISKAVSGTVNPVPKMDCGGACEVRCKLSSRPRLCKRACGTCCARCNCVPPGTSGNYEACACYATMTTRNNKRKCP
ncbi:snakin-2-like isoform X1 [Primulina huaijiensis]|uniref:snakin-2-like isoform X1 n=1 Tax=Primulina huaijiensis TaxID=1492673 RepID=UPI003CC733CA